ncbi:MULTISPECIES: hypothetical protein [Niastella]|uniref:Uncharacterized protein n=1 Tax=Niastella soli TaxID=2821487 RepID=A0ABS3YXH8_9BACT|nr:hypothetical protein [Niastella soli]MBO9202598.1 hypothetical protein [Niastella soli]
MNLVKDMSQAGRETAGTMYHNTDIWHITGPVDAIFWRIWSAGGAWQPAFMGALPV